MPTLFLGLGLIVLLMLFAAVGVAVFRRITKPHVREGHNDVIVPLFLTAGTLYAVLLGFLVIGVWENYGAANDNAAEEASTLTTLYRQTNGMGPSEQHTMRALLREYTNAVTSDEWAIQATSGGASTIARRAIGKIYRTYASMSRADSTRPISTEFLQTLRTLASDRNRRTLQANESLPGILWFGLLLGGVIVVGMTFLLYMEALWPHILASLLMATLIGTLLFITLLLNRPFSGPLAITSDSFAHALQVFNSVDRGN